MIKSLKKAGLPFREQLTEYYRRFSFALTPFIVSIVSSALGGRFKKNILLMSLVVSLVISVGYYVLQMVSVLFAKLGYISPLVGAWGAICHFSDHGVLCSKRHEVNGGYFYGQNTSKGRVLAC